MNITLIAPPWYFLDEVIWLSQNLGLGYIASTLENQGHQVTIIDALTEGIEIVTPVQTKYLKVNRIGLPYNTIAEKISPKTDLIGITAPFTDHATIVKELSKVIKQNFPNIPIVLGGVYPSTLPEQALTDSIDFVVRGEGENPISQLAAGTPVKSIRGLVFKENDTIINTGQAEPIINLDDIPYPARHLLPIERYITCSPRKRRNRRTISMITSRGCPYHCTFCSIHKVNGYRWRYRSPENVLNEIKEVVKQYQIQHIEFEDDNITMDPKRAERLFEQLAVYNGTLNGALTWSTPNGVRIDTLNRDLLKLMRDSGCESLYFGIESGDPKILMAMKKQLDLTKVEQVTEWCGELGIPAYGFLILGYPGEDHTSFKRTIKYCKRLLKKGLRGFWCFFVSAYPETELYTIAKQKGYLMYDDTENVLRLFDYSTGRRDVIDLITPDFTPEELKWRLTYAYSQLAPQGFRPKLTITTRIKNAIRMAF
ncbi:MAG: B12-binding domain-containing radical SAM protein [bacterium]|nr:B12-binding domain-containing radical SAM protein [bacterium]